MANGTGFITRQKKTLGDVAVDGLLAGMAAGLMMGTVLVAAEWLRSVGPLATLGRFDPANNGSAAIGGLLHLAISGIYGVSFALVYRLLADRWEEIRRFRLLVGAVYGLVLWLSAQFLFLPGLDSALTEVAPISFALAHAVYGTALGYLIDRHGED